MRASRVTPQVVTPEVALRLYKHATMLPNGCMHWNGMVHQVGEYIYPMMSIKGRNVSARLIAYIIKHDEVPPYGGVSPSCGDDLCVRPAHQLPKYTVKNPFEKYLAAKAEAK